MKNGRIRNAVGGFLVSDMGGNPDFLFGFPVMEAGAFGFVRGDSFTVGGNMPKASIIMPSFNVAAYIRECMDSVVRQTLRDIEIICVDAGSTDGTLEILKEYEEKDRRIRVLMSAQKSYGFQMNLGIQEAVGEYVDIVETDDFILPEMYEVLYKYAVQNNADFVKSDFDIFTTLDDGTRLCMEYSLKRHSGIRYGTVCSSRDFIKRT